jgi:hypothetical protein
MDGFFSVTWWVVPFNSGTHVSNTIIQYVGLFSCSEKEGMALNVFEQSMPIK